MRAILLGMFLLLGCTATAPEINERGDQENQRYLSSIGAPKAFTSAPHSPADFALIADGFRSGRFPSTFAPMLIAEQQLMPSLRTFIEASPEFRLTKSELRASLARQLGEREHLFRRGTTYTEDTSNIDEVQSMHMLVLLKRYSDFFGKQSVIDQLPKTLFPEKQNGESGGLVMWNKDKLLLYPIRSFDNEDEQKRLGVNDDYYRVPRILYYLPSVGLFHSHQTGYGISAIDRSGPSCSCMDGRPVMTGIEDGADTVVAEALASSNPYFMHIVVTEIETHVYNVDAYFFDVVTSAEGLRKASGVSVIDLGIFRAK